VKEVLEVEAERDESVSVFGRREVLEEALVEPEQIGLVFLTDR
jgi:hypothetical protein